MEDESVMEETPAVESETTEAPQGQEQTTSEVEMSEATTSESEALPTEEAKEETPRSEKRIQQLAREKNEAKEEAEYWKNLAGQAPPMPETPEDGYVTAEQVADTVLAKQEGIRIQEQKKQAQKALENDIVETLKAHPNLETDDDLAKAVYANAQTQGISLKASAEWFEKLITKEKETAVKKEVAARQIRSGVSSPQGSSVSKGESGRPNINSMTEDEKAANWNDILASYQ